MQTLVYTNNRFNRPNTLLFFLQSNIDKSPLLQIDCLTPYHGTEKELINDVCAFLNGLDSNIVVKYRMTQNVSIDESNSKQTIDFMVIQINIMTL